MQSAAAGGCSPGGSLPTHPLAGTSVASASALQGPRLGWGAWGSSGLGRLEWHFHGDFQHSFFSSAAAKLQMTTNAFCKRRVCLHLHSLLIKSSSSVWATNSCSHCSRNPKACVNDRTWIKVNYAIWVKIRWKSGRQFSECAQHSNACFSCKSIPNFLPKSTLLWVSPKAHTPELWGSGDLEIRFESSARSMLFTPYSMAAIHPKGICYTFQSSQDLGGQPFY